MLLHQFSPHYHFREVHACEVRASPSVIYDAIQNVRASEVALMRVLFEVRSLPARIAGRGGLRFTDQKPLLEQMRRHGFLVLGEEPQRELVLGAVGKFWSLRGASFLPLPDADAFRAYDEPGSAKAVMNFLIVPGDAATCPVLRTETRVSVADPRARRVFGLYWLIIYPGSALIRLMWLRAVRRRAVGQK